MCSNHFLNRFIIFRFPIAIKDLIGSNQKDIELLLDEAKCMIQVGTYHPNIVNLQGVTYKENKQEKRLEEV